MFVGHFAVAYAAKPAAPRVQLAWLFLAAQLLDILWPILIFAGVEHARVVPGITAFTPLDLYDYPWSHSLVTSAIWAVLFGGIWFAWKRDRAGALVLGALVFSHWVLDFATHRPDVPLWPGGSARLGLGLWNSIPGTLAVETSMFAIGLWLYARATGAARRWGFWVLAAVLYACYLTAAFAPPPQDIRVAAGGVGLIVVVVVAAYFVDRRRAAAA
jgi:hypothetical protein